MKKKKILCIDDSINLLQALKRRFEFEIQNVEVITATNGEDGLARVKSENPDLIILDVNMPGMSGSDVLGELKASRDSKDIPVIILTSCGPEERAKFLEAGAVDYISSPFDTDALVKNVKKVLD